MVQPSTCELCGASDPRLDPIGISFGMYGFDYAFCMDCLKSMSAEELFERVFEGQNYAWPPVRKPNVGNWDDYGEFPASIPRWNCAASNRERRQVTPAGRERSKLSGKLRLQIIERDGQRCRFCGAHPGDGATLHVDHIKPISNGGKSKPENLQTLCSECNLGKGTSALTTGERGGDNLGSVK